MWMNYALKITKEEPERSRKCLKTFAWATESMLLSPIKKKEEKEREGLIS